MDFNTEVGWRIKMLRESRHYTREQLAELAEISAKFLGEIENGRKGCSARILYRIALALDVDADYLLTGRYAAAETGEFQHLVSRFQPEQKDRVEKLLEIVYEMCDRT